MSEHELWNELGNLYFMSGAYNQAEYAYHRSIQLDCSFGRPYSNLALTYVQQGKYQEAIELYRSSIELLADNKEKAISWSRLGNVYRHLKDYTKAVVAYQEADALDPQTTADLLPQAATDILPQAMAEIRPQSAADDADHTVPDLLPQSSADVQLQAVLETPESAADLVDQTEAEPLPQINADVQLQAVLETPESTADLADQTEAEPLSQSSADVQLQAMLETPESAADLADQTQAEPLPQTSADIQLQAVLETPEISEAPKQAEEIILTEEESVQLESALPDVSLVEENEEPALGPMGNVAEISSETGNIENESLEQILAEASFSSPIPEESELPTEEELELISSLDPAPLLPEDSTASWALADLPRYQEDISESPENGSLTIWGEPEFEDEDWELYPAPDLEPDGELPDEGDGLTRWRPIPEEETGNQLAAMEQVEETQEEMLEPVEEPSLFYQVTEPVNSLESFSEPLPENSTEASPHSTEEMPEQIETGFPLALPSRSSVCRVEESAAPALRLLDVEVEERPFTNASTQFIPEFVLLDGTTDPASEAEPENRIVQPEVKGSERETQEMQELEAGIAKFKRAVQVNPHNAYAWDALGTLYKSAGLYKDAIAAYQQATSINPPKALYFHNLGLVYACEGRDEDAIDAFQKVVEIDPDYSLAHATLGGYYRKMGQEELAQKHIGKAMKNIFDSENEYNRACLEAICGNTDHALELLRVALRNKQTYVDWILRDPDLDFIRQDPRFKQLVSDYAR